MTITTLVKYLDYLLDQIQNVINASNFGQDQHYQLINEINRFKNIVNESELPELIKTEISCLQVKIHQDDKVNQGNRFRLLLQLIMKPTYMKFENFQNEEDFNSLSNLILNIQRIRILALKNEE